MNFNDQASHIDRNSYSEAINYLYSLQHHGIKFGLKNTLRLLSILGNPQKSFRAVHIAGTNGKGSTSAFVSSILSKAGYKVGLFTSPHLVSFTERIKVKGTNITESEVAGITNSIRKLIAVEKDLSPTFFEFVTAMAFHYFKMNGIQWAVVETGMGGKLDATNVLNPEINIITRISIDHTEFLGTILEEIAGEKAGTIKNKVPVVIGLQDREAREVINQRALEKHAPVSSFGEDFHARAIDAGVHGSRFDYISAREIKDVAIPLCGHFQIENAAIAIKTIELLNDTKITDEIIKDGLSSTRWEGRCELYTWQFPILFDGAHNRYAAESLASVINNIHLKEFKSIILVIGMMGDKDIEGMLKHLLPLARITIFLTLKFQRAASAQHLHSIADRMGIRSIVANDMEESLAIAADHYRKGDLVVVTGSFYTVGEAKGLIGQDSSLRGLTEFP